MMMMMMVMVRMMMMMMMMRWFISLSTAQVAQGSFLWPVSDRWRLMLIDAHDDHDDGHDDDGHDDDQMMLQTLGWRLGWVWLGETHTLQTSQLQLLETWIYIDENVKKNVDDDDFDFDSTLGVDGQIDDKVDGAVEDEEEVGGLGEEVDHIRFQVLNSIACRKSKSCCL